MKRVITCLQIQIELTPYNDDGQVMPRPRVDPLVVFESQIPDHVKEWLEGFLKKAEG